VLELRQAIGKVQQLVDLLLVFGKHEPGTTVSQEIGRFLVQHVAIEAETQGPDGVACDFRRDPVRPVVADDADDVAAPEA
jgi:nitrogen-specific signal transduction histidine kinase